MGVLPSGRPQGSWCRRRRNSAQALADLLLAQGPGLDAISAAGPLVWRYQLHGTGTVTANRSQQIESAGAGGLKTDLRPEAPTPTGSDKDNGRNWLDCSQDSA